MADTVDTSVFQALTITANDDKVHVTKSGKVKYGQLAETANVHTGQIKELQLAILTFNKVIHVFKDRGLNALEKQILQNAECIARLNTRIQQLEEALLASSDEEVVINTWFIQWKYLERLEACWSVLVWLRLVQAWLVWQRSNCWITCVWPFISPWTEPLYLRMWSMEWKKSLQLQRNHLYMTLQDSIGRDIQ